MRRVLWIIDLACVLVFVAIGRSVHQHGLDLSGLASTAWPFITGLAAGWITVSIRGTAGESISGGVIVAMLTVAVGMVLRVVAGQGTAFAFVLVALGFLGATMVGWRLLGVGLRRLHPRDRSS